MDTQINIEKDFWSVCDQCGQMYYKWVGSTPCCGSLAYIKTEKDFRKEKIDIIIKKTSIN
jgi:predicted ATP-dependent serine protease